MVPIPWRALGDGVEQAPDRPAAARRPEDAIRELDLGRDVADEDVLEIFLLELLRLPRLVPSLVALLGRRQAVDVVFSAAPRQTFETTARAFPVKASPMPRKSSTRGIRSAESTTRASAVSLVSVGSIEFWLEERYFRRYASAGRIVRSY